MGALEASETFAILAELGAILLLFEVGLESTPKDMMAVGVPATVVALVGVAAPMALGYGVGRVMLPGESWMAHAFLGAMLAATSVGITARVLQEAKAMRTPSARIILGAAVIDDVLGLVVLAIIAGVIQAAGEGTVLAASGIVLIVLKALGFLVGAILVGSYASPRLFHHALALRSTGVIQALALGFCFGLAWLAARAGLAPIVGAFAAGLVMEDVHFEDHLKRGDRPLHESLHALTGLLVPVFFVRMGMLVHVESLADAGRRRLRSPDHGGGHARQVGVRPRHPAGLLGENRRARDDAAWRGRPHLRRHRGGPGPRREAGREPGDLRRRRLHGRGHDHGDPTAAPLVAEAGRVRGATGRGPLTCPSRRRSTRVPALRSHRRRPCRARAPPSGPTASSRWCCSPSCSSCRGTSA